MDISRSLEDLYLDSTGMCTIFLPKQSFNKSIENYDGFSDILYTEYTRSEEDLTFIDAFQMIETKNAADKVNMCRKLAANYGVRSDIDNAAGKSIESFCNMMSLEGAEQAASVGTNKAQTPVTVEKKRGFFKTIFEAIAKFFEMIANLFKHFVTEVGNFFRRKNQQSDNSNKQQNVEPTVEDDVEEETAKPGMKERFKAGANLAGKGKGIKAGANLAGKGIKAGVKTVGNYATKVREFHAEQQSLRVRLDLSRIDYSKMVSISKEYSTTAAASKKLLDKNVLESFGKNDVASSYAYSTVEQITMNLNRLLKQFGYEQSMYKLNKVANSKEGKSLLEFEKYYKLCEDSLINTNRKLDNYRKAMKSMYNINIIKETQWIKSVYRGEQQLSKDVERAFNTSSKIFSESAEIYSNISKQLADHVDKMIITRTSYSQADGSQNSNFVYDKKFHTQTTKVESEIRVVAALLRLSSRVGKTIMEEFKHILQTYTHANTIYHGYTASDKKSDNKNTDANFKRSSSDKLLAAINK